MALEKANLVCFSREARQVQNDRDLAADCARHARMFFNNPDFDLDHAVPGTLALTPPDAMLELLERDYDAMAVMITGAVPPFAEILPAISALERRLNAAK